MAGFFRELASIAVLAFSVSTMLAAGLGHTLHHLFTPMRDARAVIRALLANFVLVPLLALATIRALPLSPSYASGVMLLATAAGAPILLKLTRAAHGNVPLSASLLMLLLPITVFYMPFVVPLVVPGARVSPIAVALPLLVTMLLPMAAGLLLRARKRALAERLQPWAGRASTVALVTVILATVAASARGLGRLIGEGAILAPLVVILGAFAIGYLLGREYRGGDVVLGFGTAQRNIAAAMVVATQGLGDPDAVLMLVVASLLQFALLFPLAWMLKRTGVRRVART
ncbi:bile acid:sodium symporter family protein [Vulgatibacter sp.]|uniref:bile acid:sodium symporter family protein n=1 Tax=Vulgatibacter sp. TaxID=1971226 RepID=UPI0035649708